MKRCSLFPILRRLSFVNELGPGKSRAALQSALQLQSITSISTTVKKKRLGKQWEFPGNIENFAERVNCSWSKETGTRTSPQRRSFWSFKSKNENLTEYGAEIEEPLLKQIFNKFSNPSKPDEVSYDSFLNFISRYNVGISNKQLENLPLDSAFLDMSAINALGLDKDSTLSFDDFVVCTIAYGVTSTEASGINYFETLDDTRKWIEQQFKRFNTDNYDHIDFEGFMGFLRQSKLANRSTLSSFSDEYWRLFEMFDLDSDKRLFLEDFKHLLAYMYISHILPRETEKY